MNNLRSNSSGSDEPLSLFYQVLVFTSSQSAALSALISQFNALWRSITTLPSIPAGIGSLWILASVQAQSRQNIKSQASNNSFLLLGLEIFTISSMLWQSFNSSTALDTSQVLFGNGSSGVSPRAHSMTARHFVLPGKFNLSGLSWGTAL